MSQQKQTGIHERVPKYNLVVNLADIHIDLEIESS